jgi:cob(I)alamin adenosyltransferase
MDMTRTGVRRAERFAAKMRSEDMIKSPQLLRYLNRLSEMIFLLSGFEESDVCLTVENHLQEAQVQSMAGAIAQTMAHHWWKLLFVLLGIIVFF